MFKREKYISKIIYYVNAGSFYDINHQLKHFCENLNLCPNTVGELINVIIYKNDRGIGH